MLNMEYAIFLTNGGMVFSMLLCFMTRCRNSTQCIDKRKDSIMNVMQLNTDIYNSLGELPFELFHYACHMPPHRSFFFAAYEICGYL